MNERNKPRHELCVDKTSCKAEYMNNMAGTQNSPQTQSGANSSQSADTIAQQYIQSQKQKK